MGSRTDPKARLAEYMRLQVLELRAYLHDRLKVVDIVSDYRPLVGERFGFITQYTEYIHDPKHAQNPNVDYLLVKVAMLISIAYEGEEACAQGVAVESAKFPAIIREANAYQGIQSRGVLRDIDWGGNIAPRTRVPLYEPDAIASGSPPPDIWIADLGTEIHMRYIVRKNPIKRTYIVP
jgi:hypothetical protein